ncbi:MAG: hypothetical protein MK179_14150 [Pirellulaceae bacterium]|nr:hypothetical protein [Pirellulaceae bacterium]
MSRLCTLLATLLLFTTQGTVSAEESFLGSSFQMANDAPGNLSGVERSNHWTIRGQCDSCDDGCCATCDAGCCKTWVGGSELVFLRPHTSEPYYGSGELQTASRWTLGRMNNSGQTWRVRYFEFQHDDFDSESLQQELIDAEYAGRFELGCNWRGEIAAGLRHAQYKDDDSEYDATIGPVVSVEVHNQILSDVDAFALCRTSQQFGSQERGRGTFGVTEIQVGAEITRCVARNNLFIRGFIEAQEWTGVEDGDSQDIGLIGLGFAVGIAR